MGHRKVKIQPELLQSIKRYFTENTEILLAYLFGSQATGQTGPASDYDFGLLLGSPSSETQSQINHHLVKILKTDGVDVVLLNHAPIELAYNIIAHGQLIYQHNLTSRVETEANIMSRYGDYLPILRAQRDEILRGGQHEAGVQRYREAFRRTERTLKSLRAAKKQKPE